MPNKTRANILSQLYEYLPNADLTSHNTLTDNLCDIVVEEISGRHNFSYLAANAPATAAIAADVYYLDESDFSFTRLKEIFRLQWIKSSTGEHADIDWLPPQKFIDRFGYVEWAGNSDGKPYFYTRFKNRFHFNVQADEAITARAWYYQYHGNFADDDAVHVFQPDNMGFQAIVAGVLKELHIALPGMEISKKALSAAQQYESWIAQLIAHDESQADEEIQILPAHKDHYSRMDSDPYDWVS